MSSNKLDMILAKIGEEFGDNISAHSRFYLEVDLGKQAEKLGYSDLKDKYRKINAIIPLKQPVSGMKVRIDGRTFVNYEQFGSGIAVPAYIARETDMPRKTYIANDSMILNFN